MRLGWLIVFALMTVLAILSFSKALKKKIGILSLGAKEERFDNPNQRFMNFVKLVLGQSKLINEPYGVVHFIIFWGFIFICLGELPLIFEGLFPAYSFPILGTNRYFYMIKDLMTALVIVGLCFGLIRRWVIKPAHLSRTPEAAIIVSLIFGVIVTEWIGSGAKVALDPSNSVYSLAIMYQSFATLFSGLSTHTLELIESTFWWIHMLIVFGFLVYIPNSKHMHLLAVHPNTYFSSLKPIGGQIEKIDLEDEELTELGVNRIESFTWKQLLDSFACGECGRCMNNCPANISGKPLNPKRLISRQLKDHLLEKGAVLNAKGLTSTSDENADALAEIAENDPQAAEILQKSLIGDIVSEEEIWACTTCMSCQVQCPVANEHVNKIINMRQSLVMMDSNFPQELQTSFRNVENNANPWGIGYTERANWASDLDVKLISEQENVDYLFWVGCAGSFDSRAQKVTVAVSKILKAAGVNFAILGTEEKCCGDFVRRSGNEYLFQTAAIENVEILNNYNVKKIITTCPHCLNTLKNEYPDFGGNYEVIHHTKFIDQLIKDGKLVLNSKAEFEPQRIVYHDSCYLGRYQQEFNSPRALFNMVPGVELVEMDRHHNKSFCCGAGGGRMWLEEQNDQRVNNLRVEQALDKNAEVIGANCPFCITMMEDGIKDKVDTEKQTVKVLDPAELIAKMIS
ncbi:heterodisulfide reductase-related iron-sulfur binding cluster [Desulfosporosinus meridiei]|uniref:Fe-S oxidoreductase n=1 Tax=Desulfosporosinus meridiei (strain ATCC BAA-275 / DSM 13257 / KCTC 12902 / NCIMB 13706 / S10) TaxID=768704 RepID=J7IW51_DESMD|nr:(Fe-S)-binding protein [Desulfosporosinus meridiei]AFQ44374.1 Fe-S oxidoreductase [Desulfosporosinus meridiei DSM 13257]